MAWIGLWHFDDVGSSTVVDVSGNGHDITLPGTAAQISSSGVLDDGALSKTGLGTIPLPAGLLAASETDDRTIMLDGAAQRSVWWVRWESASLGTGVWGMLSLSETAMVARARSQANGSPSPAAPTIGTITTGVRHNYAITYQRSTGILSYYYDGALAGTANHTPGTELFVGADEVNIAEWSLTGAAIDNLRIANHCADAVEIAALAGQPVTAEEPPHAEGTVTLSASTALLLSGLRASAGSVGLSASAGLTAAGVRASVGGVALAATTSLATAGVRSSAGSARLSGTAGLQVAGSSHRAGSVTLSATAAIRVAEAGQQNTPPSRTYVVPAENRTVMA